MTAPAKSRDFNIHLEILGQQPSMRGLYTQVCFCFPVADDAQYAKIEMKLRDGIELLSASFPWIAGQVVSDSSESDGQESFKIAPFERLPRLIIKDLRENSSAPTMDALRQASFPMRLLDENIIAPCTTLPGGPGKSASDPAPVFLIQMNIIHGGLLLTFVGQHNTMDMTGQGQLIDLIDKACRNEPFNHEEIQSGNLERRNIIPLLDDSQANDSRTTRQTATRAAWESGSISDPPQCQWAYFTFSASSLANLKSLATSTISSGYVSTDDALTAFIWQRTSQARSPRLDSASTVWLARAVNVRRFLGISPTYPGFIQNMTYHSYRLQDLVAGQLGAIASDLRAPLDPQNSTLGYDTRALATVLSRAKDKNAVSFVATLDTSKDIMLSSWAQLDCYALEFGLGLGKPESVRRPQFAPVESLFYLMPKSSDGDISAALCLRDEDMDRLKADVDFTVYGRYIG
jgi:trichothecene 3-O-acetyltransferase